MQNRKLQGEDIEKLKKEEQSTLSETQITGAESVMGPGSYSGRPLIPSASNKVSLSRPLSILSAYSEAFYPACIRRQT